MYSMFYTHRTEIELAGGGCGRNKLAVVIKVHCRPLKLILTHFHKANSLTSILHKKDLTVAVLVLDLMVLTLKPRSVE